MTGEAKCLACGFEWIAVAEIGCTALECPKCGCDRGRTKGPCWPADGTVFVCNCGCDVFVLRRSGALCIGCGITPTSWVDG